MELLYFMLNCFTLFALFYEIGMQYDAGITLMKDLLFLTHSGS